MANELRDELRQKLEAKIRAKAPVRTALLAETLGVSELELLLAWPGEATVELDPARVEPLIQSFPALGRVYTIVRNEGTVAEMPGIYTSFSRSGPYLNVDGEGLHMHLRLAAFYAAVSFNSAAPDEEPRPSIQFFSAAGHSVLKVFFLPNISGEENFPRVLDEWRRLCAQYRLA